MFCKKRVKKFRFLAKIGDEISGAMIGIFININKLDIVRFDSSIDNFEYYSLFEFSMVKVNLLRSALLASILSVLFSFLVWDLQKMFLFLLKFMIFLLNHGGFLSSQVMVSSWRIKFESTLLMVSFRMDTFSLMVFL